MYECGKLVNLPADHLDIVDLRDAITNFEQCIAVLEGGSSGLKVLSLL